ncbi:MAG TPA: hypothetical protein PLE32_03785 [Haliscomenobacter sp.]|nr:hypothetical protein [Haliscomenobacter sp.]
MKAEDLAPYVMKAVLSWGKVEDFKHFLPRLLELIAATGLAYGYEVVLGKLEYAKWNEWEETEKDAIRAFLLAWWAESLTNNETWGLLQIKDLYPFFGDVAPFLERWSIDVNDHSFRNLIHFILSNYHDLVERKSHFKEFAPASLNKLLSWILAKKELLEQGFFHFESIDPVFAKEISDALYLLDWVPFLESKQR